METCLMTKLLKRRHSVYVVNSVHISDKTLINTTTSIFIFAVVFVSFTVACSINVEIGSKLIALDQPVFIFFFNRTLGRNYGVKPKIQLFDCKL